MQKIKQLLSATVFITSLFSVAFQEEEEKRSESDDSSSLFSKSGSAFLIQKLGFTY